MGSGDLDGDVYWVCWDKNLTSKVTTIAHVESAKPVVRKAESDTIQKDICFVLSNENLG